MSGPKFMVFKLKDLRIPVIILLVALAVFGFFLYRNNSNATETFAPSDTYEDGKYIAGIHLSDASMDLVVKVKDSKIASISLEGFDETASTLYKDLEEGLTYLNTYVVATQSLEFPESTTVSSATSMLMDAVKVALSDNPSAQISSTYESLQVPNGEIATDTNTSSQTDTTANTNSDATSNTEATDNHPSIMNEEITE